MRKHSPLIDSQVTTTVGSHAMATEQPKILTRVSFNFANRCNMSCRFCYIPFDRKSSDFATWCRVVDRVIELGARQITFGGGDPFGATGKNSHSPGDFLKFLQWARTATPNDTFIQVDTNAIGLDTAMYDALVANVDMLGLPIEAATPELHAAMRGMRGHFPIVYGHFEVLSRLMPTKINTMVGTRNVDELPALQRLLSDTPPSVWSIYQFWPIGDIAVDNRDDFLISDEVYLRSAEAIRETTTFCDVEVGSIRARSGAYFFCTQTGRAYATSATASGYIELGSVFDDDVLDRWTRVANVDANRNRTDSRKQTASAIRVKVPPST